MPYCGICWQVRAPSFSLSHPWNIYQHNLSPLDQLYTCHGLAINYLHAPDKHLSHWFLSLIWDGYTGRAFLSLCLLTFGQSPWGAKRSWQFRLKQQPPEKASGLGARTSLPIRAICNFVIDNYQIPNSIQDAAYIHDQLSCRVIWLPQIEESAHL